MHQQQQSPANISIKVTLTETNENRFIALPSPPSFALLFEKITTVFDKVNRETVLIHYVDNESDRVTVSSSDELACALSFLPAGRTLRLFIDSTQSSTPPQQVPIQEPTDVVPTGTTATDVDDLPQALNDDIKAQDELPAIDVLKRMLSQEAGIVVGVNVCEKRCLRVLSKFGGDVDKAVTALERLHQRTQRQLPANDNKKQPMRPDSPQRESLHQQRQARRAERLAARLARQEKKQLQLGNAHTAIDKRVDKESVEALVALMAGLGLVIPKGRCTGALRRADGDVDAAKAELVDWCAKRQERQRNNANKTTRAPSEDQETVEGDDTDKEKLLAQLDQMGFGAPSGSTDKEAERIRKRNERLLKKLKGDVDQVVCLLKARNAKVEERMAARKAHQAERPRSRRNEKQAEASAT